MTILVDFGLLQGSTIDPTYLLVGHPTQGLIGTGRIAPEDVLADYSARLMSMQVQRTSTRRTGPVIEYNAGTASVTLLNDDGALDPYTLDAAGLVAPGAVMRIRKVHEGVTYPVFYGWVDSWIPEQRGPDHAVVIVNASDALSRLAGSRLAPLTAPVGDGEDTGARIHRILDWAGWPTADRLIDTGRSTLLPTQLGTDPLSVAQEVALNEIGDLYADAEGRIVFRHRHRLLTDTRSTTSQATFGSGPGELRWVDSLGLSHDRGALINRVTATVDLEDAVPQTASDTASIDRYGVYPHEETLQLETNDEAAGWASYVLRQNHLPEFRVTSMVVDVRVDPAALFPQVLGRDFGDRVTVVRRPPGGIVDAREVFVRSIEHTWSPPDQWRTSWELQPADRYLFMTVGHPSMGVIGENALAY
ncbi:hypothetical protein [Micromonospora sp. NPDC005652]|uniref:hypothetical protein n=1 Tax=Micromonospora sp. NPDC005652 TaxID=3157046 RepID=UPI00340C84AD